MASVHAAGGRTFVSAPCDDAGAAHGAIRASEPDWDDAAALSRLTLRGFCRGRSAVRGGGVVGAAFGDAPVGAACGDRAVGAVWGDGAVGAA